MFSLYLLHHPYPSLQYPYPLEILIPSPNTHLEPLITPPIAHRHRR
jgi:hypothetical protein